MTHTRWQQLRDEADTATDAVNNAQVDLKEWLRKKGWKEDDDVLARRCPWIEPREGGHFKFEAAVLLEEGRDG